jgi:hypothetical protein
MPSKFERAIRVCYVDMRAMHGVREAVKLTAEKFNLFPVVVCRVLGLIREECGASRN